ncbi:TOM1-like protein 2 [Araneus ventricosus]|uniref:TOM1-like protein 2 n=1 Tax=Araneus ventricosus TaxID=182803 RepID=A0A4Y2C0D2_ARAVE|nr:TOM1-like protein 2 [Araneus ventricosus]
MATLLSQLGVGGNPFSTAVGQRIEQATDGSLASENWALNMEICDVINETDEGPKDALRAIRKRLLQNAGKNYTVVMFTLTVLETCVKNCGKRFQLLATQKDFVQDLVKLIGPKNDPPTAVQEKVLSLIQSWAETFRANPEMQGVVQVYNDLKQKGIEFPPSDLETMAPIITPSRSVPVQPPTQHQVHEPLPQEPDATTIHLHQIDKLKKELEIVRGNMRVFGEMLTELVPGKEHQSDLELLQGSFQLRKIEHIHAILLEDCYLREDSSYCLTCIVTLPDGPSFSNPRHHCRNSAHAIPKIGFGRLIPTKDNNLIKESSLNLGSFKSLHFGNENHSTHHIDHPQMELSMDSIGI